MAKTPAGADVQEMGSGFESTGVFFFLHDFHYYFRGDAFARAFVTAAPRVWRLSSIPQGFAAIMAWCGVDWTVQMGHITVGRRGL